MTEFVRYECVIKRRSVISDAEQGLIDRFKQELQRAENFARMDLSVDDLREVARIEAIRRLGRGELAAIVLARKTRQGLLTDDRAARNLVASRWQDLEVRTTSHLAGWLVYVGELVDGDIPVIVRDNEQVRGKGSIGKYIWKCYEHAQMLKLKEAT